MYMCAMKNIFRMVISLIHIHVCSAVCTNKGGHRGAVCFKRPAQQATEPRHAGDTSYGMHECKTLCCKL